MMTDELNGLVRLTKNDIRPAALTAAKAFYEYPLSAYFVPDASKRLKKQAASFAGLIRSAIDYREVYTTSPEMEGIAVWFPPGVERPPAPRGMSVARLLLRVFADREQIRRVRAFGEYAGAVKRRVVPGKHWYLQLLAVHPAYQGKGLSSRLLNPVLARADREGLPCFLETQAEKNVKLYEHFGFRVAEEGAIPGSDIRSWAMVRGK